MCQNPKPVDWFRIFLAFDQAPDVLHASNAAQFESLFDPIPMVRRVWAIIGMAIFRHVPMT